ncbi:unnamed protein product [Owenia fusiformis]|uniref:STAS domain-containing protein n=1 Tax=Owenia fusiformis TaxID=6347 RepID=A0A8S4PJ37_OWEFU|nr:unnamed protein product [Owenia fusiformis]
MVPLNKQCINCTTKYKANKSSYTEMASLNDGFSEDDFRKADTGRCGCVTKEDFKKTVGKHITFNRKCLQLSILKRLPFLSIMRDYSLKRDLLKDILAGLTNGIMHVPQGMAFATLAALPPVTGLYVSFFVPLVYFFFGTSRHISIGTSAVVSLLVGNVVSRYGSPVPPANQTVVNITTPPTGGFTDVETFQISVAVGLALLTGLIQVGMWLFHLGFITAYLSDAVLSGFTTAAGFHVLTSQVSTVFGLTIGRYSGAWKLIYTYRDIVLNIVKTNVATLITSIICIVVLLIVKDFINGNPRIKAKMKIPIPIELFVVIIGTIVSFFTKLNFHYGVAIVGVIPQGLPTPSVPNLGQAGEYVPDALVIAIVGYAVHIAMAKLFAKKHGYEVDPNQELLANGLANTSCSFFLCFPCTTSMSRSIVLESAGGATQLCAVVSSGLLLIVLYVLGEYLYHLPKCILASIVIVAIKNMFKQFTELKRLWYFSKIDAVVWFVSWLATMLLDTDLGLLVGAIFCLVTFLFRVQWPNTYLMGKIDGTNIYRDIKDCEKASGRTDIHIFRLNGSLSFINREQFQRHLYSDTGFNPALVKIQQKLKAKNKDLQLKKYGTPDVVENGHANEGFHANEINAEETKTNPIEVIRHEQYTSHDDDYKHSLTHIVLDCSTMAFIDSAGITVLNLVIEEYKETGVGVILAGCTGSVRKMLVQQGFFEKHGTTILYATAEHAVKDIVESRNDIGIISDILETNNTQL